MLKKAVFLQALSGQTVLLGRNYGSAAKMLASIFFTDWLDEPEKRKIGRLHRRPISWRTYRTALRSFFSSYVEPTNP